MIVQRAWPPGPPIDTEAPFARQRLAELYAPPDPERSLRINLVASVDGAVHGQDGTSASLSGGADREILGAIRSVSDVVLIGGGTLRREGHLLPRSTPLAVVTRSGDLGGATVEPRREHGPILVLGPAAARDRVAETFPAAHQFVPLLAELTLGAFLPSALVQLVGRGWRHVVCEGGPSLVRALLRLQLVDELCLTTSPLLAGPAAGGMLDGPLDHPLAAPLVQLLVDEAGYSYARRRLR